MYDREDIRQPYIVCCSSYTDEAFSSKVYQAGVDNFIAKPAEQATITNLVNLAFSFILQKLH